MDGDRGSDEFGASCSAFGDAQRMCSRNLFGEIRDEFDFEGPELTKTGEHEWLISGGIDIKRLSDEPRRWICERGGGRAHAQQPDSAYAVAGFRGSVNR